MKEILVKVKEYEDLLKDLQKYFYKSVECRVTTELEHKKWIAKINDVLFNPPTQENMENLGIGLDVAQ